MLGKKAGALRRFVAVVAMQVVGAAAAGCGPSKPAEEPEPAPVEAPPAPAPPAEPPPQPSLYERLGKKEALDGVVEELLGNVLADRRISKLFDKSRKPDHARQLHARFVAELCVVAGGTDCGYDGKSMKDAHQGMGIGQPQWDAFIEDLRIALKTRSVDDALAQELVTKLEEQTKAGVMAPAKGK